MAIFRRVAQAENLLRIHSNLESGPSLGRRQPPWKPTSLGRYHQMKSNARIAVSGYPSERWFCTKAFAVVTTYLALNAALFSRRTRLNGLSIGIVLTMRLMAQAQRARPSTTTSIILKDSANFVHSRQIRYRIWPVIGPRYAQARSFSANSATSKFPKKAILSTHQPRLLFLD
jgi:hypothetical protein